MTRFLQYVCGLLPPTLGADLVIDQMRGAHRYRNTLIEIERERRTRVRAVMASHSSVVDLEQELATITKSRDEARELILQSRKASRSRSEGSEQRAVVRRLGDRVRELRAAIRELRAAISNDPAIKQQLTDAEEHAQQRVRDARGTCGVYWGSYLLQEAAMAVRSRAACGRRNGSSTPFKLRQMQVPVRLEGYEASCSSEHWQR